MRESKSRLSDVVCFCSWNLAATKIHASWEHCPYSFFILCFSLWNRMCSRRASWQRQLFSICFTALVTFDLTSLCDISCYCEIVPKVNKCVVSWPAVLLNIPSHFLAPLSSFLQSNHALLQSGGEPASTALGGGRSSLSVAVSRKSIADIRGPHPEGRLSPNRGWTTG